MAMAPAHRALAVSAALWLCVLAGLVADADADAHPDAAADEVAPEPPAPLPTAARHIDVKSILDPVAVVGHIGDTLNHAGRVLGMRIADTVADLVSSAFGHAQQGQGYGQGYGHLPAGTVLRPAWTRGDPASAAASASMGVATGPSGPAGSPYYAVPAVAVHRETLQPLHKPSMLGGILKLLGLDSSKLGAIALNGVIFLAQLISSSLAGRPTAPTHARSQDGTAGSAKPAEARPEPEVKPKPEVKPEVEEDFDDIEPAGTPLSWILDDPAIKDSTALRQARDADLSERLIEEIQRRFPRPGSRRSRALGLDAAEADTACIQLLVCKAGPFLRGMQRSLRPVLQASVAPEAPAAPKGDPGAAGAPSGQGQSGAGRQRAEEVDASWRRLSPVQRMFAHMPTAGEVLDRADTCAQRFPNYC